MFVDNLLLSDTRGHIPNMVKVDSFDTDPLYNAEYFRTINNLRTECDGIAIEKSPTEEGESDFQQDSPRMVLEDSAGYYQTVIHLSDIESEKNDEATSESSDHSCEARFLIFKDNDSDSSSENNLDSAVKMDLSEENATISHDATMMDLCNMTYTDTMKDSAISITYSDDSRASTLTRVQHTRQSSMTDSAVSVASREADELLPVCRQLRSSLTSSVTSDSLTDSSVSLETVCARSAGDGVEKRWSTGSMIGDYAHIAFDKLPEERTSDISEQNEFCITQPQNYCANTSNQNTQNIYKADGNAREYTVMCRVLFIPSKLLFGHSLNFQLSDKG